MKNPHIIIGAGRRCLCGVYQGRTVTCSEVLDTLHKADNVTNLINMSPVNLAIASLVEDCDDTHLTPNPA